MAKRGHTLKSKVITMTRWINKLHPEGIKACTDELRGLGMDQAQIQSCFNSQKPLQEYELTMMITWKKDLQETREII